MSWFSFTQFYINIIVCRQIKKLIVTFNHVFESLSAYLLLNNICCFTHLINWVMPIPFPSKPAVFTKSSSSGPKSTPTTLMTISRIWISIFCARGTAGIQTENVSGKACTTYWPVQDYSSTFLECSTFGAPRTWWQPWIKDSPESILEVEW